MKIQTENDMNQFCKEVMKNKGISFNLFIQDDLYTGQVNLWEEENQRFIHEGVIRESSHLQQGIKEIYWNKDAVSINEVPYIYPSEKYLKRNDSRTGAITGNLANCYNPLTKDFLFHMRGKDISAPFGFQAAAAGMGYFREHPSITAKKELAEETGISYAKSLFSGNPVDCLPFMKSGQIPQLLFSFGFANNLSRFPVLKSLEDIAKFEAETKKEAQQGKLKEAYPFVIPYQNVEKIVGELNDKERFYGPIYQSTINFIKALKDSKQL